MTYIYRRDKGSRRRVAHILRHNRLGESLRWTDGKDSGGMVPMCESRRVRLDTSCNLSLGLRMCARCELLAWAERVDP